MIGPTPAELKADAEAKEIADDILQGAAFYAAGVSVDKTIMNRPDVKLAAAYLRLARHHLATAGNVEPKCTSCGEPASCLTATCEGVFGLEYTCDEYCGH